MSTKFTDQATPPEVPKVKPNDAPIAAAPVMSHNPAKIEWPSDKWGYTSKFRQQFLIAAGTVSGQPDKQALMLATLDQMRGHLLARFDKDVETRDAARAENQKFAAERMKRKLR